MSGKFFRREELWSDSTALADRARATGSVHINSKEIFLKCFIGLETWYEGSNQCEKMGKTSTIIEIGAKLSVGRQIESEEAKCLREISESLTS